MLLAQVVSKVWSDHVVDPLRGRRLVLVHELHGDQRVVAVDLLNAGAGTTVLVATDEAAAAATGEPTVDAAVVALVSEDVLTGGAGE